jgi:hypothetical protein
MSSFRAMRDRLLVWDGQGASKSEKSTWLQVARRYIDELKRENDDADLVSLAKVSEGQGF